MNTFSSSVVSSSFELLPCILSISNNLNGIFSRNNRGFSKPLCQITVCGGIINLQINKSTCHFCQIFLLDKRCPVQFLYGLPKVSNVHLLYSFIHVFIYNSITNYYWQNFAKPLAKAFRKNPFPTVRSLL